MKNSILSLVVLTSILYASCGIAADQNYNEQETVYFSEDDHQNNQQNKSFSNQNNSNMQTSSYGNQNNHQTNVNWTNQSNSPTNGGQLKQIMIPNSKTGNPMFYIPVPANWKNTPQGFKGPKGLHACEVPDASYASSGSEAIVPVKDVVNQLLNMYKQQGIQIIKTSEIPSIAQSQKRNQDQFWKSAPTQDIHSAIGIEYIKDGKKALMVIMHQSSRSQFFSFWTLSVQNMTADNDYYEEGKKAFIYALSNMQFDQKYVAQNNQQQLAQLKSSNANFNSRMRNNQANFEARNKATVGAQNDINAMSMNGYYSRSNSQDHIQQSQVQSIYGRTTVQDPSNGQNYEVEGQAQQYWMDGQGNYIPSNDLNWNPNTDGNYNNSQWTQTQNPNGGY